MTPEAFISKYGPEWKKFEFSDMGRSFSAVIEARHPARTIPQGNENLGYRTNGATAMLNEIAGYELLANLIRSLGVEVKPAPKETEETFEEEEIH